MINEHSPPRVEKTSEHYHKCLIRWSYSPYGYSIIIELKNIINYNMSLHIYKAFLMNDSIWSKNCPFD